MEHGGTCWQCGATLGAQDYRRGDLCPGCRYETRVCRNCKFHAPACNNDCSEPAADMIADKEKSNFCEYFRPAARSFKSPAAGPSSSKAKAALDALFKKRRTEI